MDIDSIEAIFVDRFIVFILPTYKFLTWDKDLQQPDIKKIDLLLKFAVVAAGQEDEWSRRELGAIHLIKYVYLADLEYAKFHEGKTFTGLPWRFYKFGPWAEGCFERLEPALSDLGAEKKIFSHPKYEDDFVRWLHRDDDLYNEIYDRLPLSVAGTISNLVHKFGSDTEGLLDFVYKTYPMLQAAPNEKLDFLVPDSEAIDVQKIEKEDPSDTLSCKQKKKQRERIQLLKQRIQQKLSQKRENTEKRFIPPPPRYDNVFFEGIKQLDSLAGEQIKTLEGIAEFSDDIWKSNARFDPEIPE